ncbi:MAG: hypothetical protein AUJ92_08965 [Armatimonadetes bacterium CG2_30_59_28]|nr:hypothetical protein [Armatimonadota bacterium]OIO94905.1 MAG: hypothetical protein AUJ92_08965 [Armatimonadetes bacterium CG2_30_59_28]PIU60748.1 MAG: hypothetical protein COS85_22830 [Armatimonadetes bacterium CG07_land_8_20_14_0_80_59_28]PIX43942.1 MAG: hypothetical protein COZ56_05945 [Armatimonadetes bacterium CG_4_8_14_3_um_filter_58_9]PIY42153.1 MAG: hypothetical protein COZ05_14425 [Armatimonadetes bacterium CG_4_10_14_3_um_filter_59_10]
MKLSQGQLEGYRLRWRVRCEQRQAEREQWKRDARECADLIARTLARDFGVETVCLVGSLTRSAVPAGRPDIDLAVRGLPADKYWKALGAACDAASPFEVDLIPVEDATPRMLEAIQEGQVLFDVHGKELCGDSTTCRGD